MFSVNRFSKIPQKFTFVQDHINESAKKYNKLMSEINEKNKSKKEMEPILYGNKNKNTLIKSTNDSVNDLINNFKIYKFFFMFSFVSIGALIFYKNKQ
jgi:hypothetical protein